MQNPGFTCDFVLMGLVVVCAFVQVRKQKWDSYSKGEELFGLPITKYEGLEKTETEIQMLDRLYSYAPPRSAWSASPEL